MKGGGKRHGRLSLRAIPVCTELAMSKSLLLLLACWSAPILAYQFPFEVTEYIDDTKVDVFIDPRDLAAQQPWKPFQAPLPLTLDQALAAIARGIKQDRRIDRARLMGVELKPIPRRPGLWHYLVKMQAQLAGGQHRPLYFIVLMNGKVIPAIREPEAIK